MEFYVSRALVIAMLSYDQLKALHEAEDKLRYCFPSGQLCEILKVSTKEYWGIPNDPGAQSEYSAMVKRIILSKNVARHEHDGYIHEYNIDTTHSYDWHVWKKRGELDFSYKKPTDRRKELRRFMENHQDLIDNQTLASGGRED